MPLSSAVKRRPLKPLNSSSPISTPNLKKDTNFKTPLAGSSPSEFQTAKQYTSPSKPDSHTILETLNSDIVVNGGGKVQLASNFDGAKFKFRTMAMKLLESADMLDDQIDNMAQLFQDANKDIVLGNPCLSSQFDIHCCGRIVPDSPLYDKLLLQDLNATSLFLETSRLSGIGQRVPLDLSSLKLYSFFPGQIVCLKGRNPSGSLFIVEQVLQLPQLGAPVTPGEELKDFKDMYGEGLKFVVAAGPFSNLNSLDYSKFNGFVDKINDDIKPQVLILLGPFIDLTNKGVAEGDIDIEGNDLTEVFTNSISPILKRISSDIQVILLPSLKDAAVNHCSYPQQSFDRKALGLPKNIKPFPNPSGFSVNEILFGCSNLDVYKDLKDVIKLDDSVFNNRFERITNHVFDQRRYYPSFPGSVARRPGLKAETDQLANQVEGVMAEEVAESKIGGSCLEVPYLGLLEIGDSLPDVLIIPSELKYFAKVVKNVITINPGSFIRPSKDGREDGTYVVMQTKAPDTEEEDNVEKVDDSDMYYHNVFKRSRIDIFRS